jgi:hypothetical protein
VALARLSVAGDAFPDAETALTDPEPPMKEIAAMAVLITDDDQLTVMVC